MKKILFLAFCIFSFFGLQAQTNKDTLSIVRSQLALKAYINSLADSASEFIGPNPEYLPIHDSLQMEIPLKNLKVYSGKYTTTIKFIIDDLEFSVSMILPYGNMLPGHTTVRIKSLSSSTSGTLPVLKFFKTQGYYSGALLLHKYIMGGEKDLEKLILAKIYGSD